jgi:UDP-N-acetylmuramoyl-tripeptide--D-alanyl-D-alanine ligase
LSQNISREVARHMGVPGDVVEAALREFKSPQGRLTRLDLPGLTVIDDTYNANPLSMKLGLDSLAEIAAAGGRRIAILGGMAELGDDTPRHHEAIAAHARARVDVLVGVGELARHYQPDHWFESTRDCAERIDDLIGAGDCLLLKGSASVRLWDLVPKLREIAEKRAAAAA